MAVRFESRVWLWWPNAIGVLALGIAVVAWFVLLGQGRHAGVWQWFTVICWILLTVVLAIGTRQQLVIDESGITHRYLATTVHVDWADLTQIRLSNPTRSWGPLAAALVGRRNRVELFSRSDARGARSGRGGVSVLPIARVPELMSTLEHYRQRVVLS